MLHFWVKYIISSEICNISHIPPNGKAGKSSTQTYTGGTWAICDRSLPEGSCLELSKQNSVVVSIFSYFHPYLGKLSILTNIFQMGWFNHQPEKTERKEQTCPTPLPRVEHDKWGNPVPASDVASPLSLSSL